MMPETGPAIVQRATHSYRQRFGREPRWVVAAPGRVNLIGEHTDYNGGFVLPMAIERRVVVAAGPADDGVKLYSQQLDATAQFGLGRPIERGEPAWSNYVRGVIAAAALRAVPAPPFHAVIASDLPIGGGLSSSAALEVAIATLIEAMTGCVFDPLDKAFLCQWAEHEYAGVPCGLMDQYVAVMGKADCLVLLDCRAATSRLVPLVDRSVAVLVANTNVKHELAASEYPRRRTQCAAAAKALGMDLLREATMADLEAAGRRLDAVVFRRARHVIGEIARTVEAAEAIGRGDWSLAGARMYASHESLRDDFEVSCGELDLMVELARSIGCGGGVYGARMTGGGFGGCTVWLVRADAAEDVGRELAEQYRRRTGVEPDLFTTLPAGGAAVIGAAG